jgi:hypothetical protein
VIEGPRLAAVVFDVLLESSSVAPPTEHRKNPLDQRPCTQKPASQILAGKTKLNADHPHAAKI